MQLAGYLSASPTQLASTALDQPSSGQEEPICVDWCMWVEHKPLFSISQRPE